MWHQILQVLPRESRVFSVQPWTHRCQFARPSPGLPVDPYAHGAPPALQCASASAARCRTRTFSRAEAERVIHAATRRGPLAEALLRLLFTTGLRIGAAAGILWHGVRRDGDIAQSTVVREKGNRPRVVLLCDSVRESLRRLYESSRSTPSDRVFPRTVRQLRNVFYRACREAGFSGPHCHPHGGGGGAE